MTGEMILTGIVLSSMPVGDYDRRVSLLTSEKGRISAFVKNARRPMSSLRAASMPFTYGRFTVYASRDAYTVNGCEDTVYFDGLSTDPDKAYFGMYFCELMSFFTRENSDEKEQVKLLYVTLKALLDGKQSLTFIRRVFELRCLANYGEAPNIFECSKCGKKTESENWFFSVKSGTILCEDCARLQKTSIGTGSPSEASMKLPETVRYTMHFIITAPYGKLFGFTLTPEMESNFFKAVAAIMKNHIDKPLKTLEILDTLGYNG